MESYLEALWSNPYALTVAVITIIVSVLVWWGVMFDRQQQRRAIVGIEDEPLEEKPLFENLPNFRQAGGLSLHNRYGKKVKDGLLFRSSRTDFLTDEEVDQFFRLDIKSIIDLRRNSEYARSGGDKILAKSYNLCILKKGKLKDWKSKRTLGVGGTSPSSQRRHYLVDVMTIEAIKNTVNRVNFFVRYSSLLLLVVDWFFGCHLFVRLYSHLVSNHETLADQYVNMLEHTKPIIVDIMRLLLEESNVPALIHCAHGKDRTGVVVALVLGCLEVEDEAIAQDYAMSEAGLAPMKQRLYRETVGKYGFKKDFAGATAETMREVLTEIKKRYDSVSGYLNSAGFTIDEQQALKDKFLETDPV